MVDKKSSSGDGKIRIAIVNPDKCKPKKCSQECAKTCPLNKQGKICIEVARTSVICFISEAMCIGCGQCVKRCPYDAIKIINLPKGLEKDTAHRYGMNSFKLHRLPMPRPGEVLGLVGTNGIGKSTALKILANQQKPNLGKFDPKEDPSWKDILLHFRGSELQNYFKQLIENDIKALTKIQYVDQLAKSKFAKQIVGKRLAAADQRGKLDEVIEALDLGGILEREIGHLSGGELQRFVIAITSLQKADIYMYDEPSSYLDVKQRLKAARLIRSMLTTNNYVIVVEHDLAILDYLSDYICCLYGKPGAYGVVTMPFSVREGINHFLAGYIPTENMRFRDEEFTFYVSESEEEKKQMEDNKTISKPQLFKYPDMTKTLGPFKLSVTGGQFTTSEITVLLGQNGTGKTTFIKMLAGITKPDQEDIYIDELSISYKP